MRTNVAIDDKLMRDARSASGNLERRHFALGAYTFSELRTAGAAFTARSPCVARLVYEELTPMPTKTARFVNAALFACAVFAQPPAEPLERVLHLTLIQSDRQLQEIATNIRGITEIPQVSVDTAHKTLTLHGTAAQIAVAEWLLNQWDNAAPAQPENLAAHLYRLSSDDIVRYRADVGG
jgi:hypothetical protein